MRKTLILLLVLVPMISSCVTDSSVEKQEKIRQQEILKQQEIAKRKAYKQKEAQLIAHIKELVTNMEKNKDISKTLEVFSDFFMDDNQQLACPYYPFSKQPRFITYNTKDNEDFDFTSLKENIKTFARQGIHMECFYKISSDYFNHSDECILERRNNPDSKICFFDYKRFLPSSAKIKTEDDFLNLVNEYQKLFRETYTSYGNGRKRFQSHCELQKEITPEERAKCEKDAKAYLIKVATEKRAIYCRDKNRKKYFNFLAEIIEEFKFMNRIVSQDIDESWAYSSTKEFSKNFYRGAFSTMAVKAIEQYGVDNFCSIEGFEKDVAKIK